MSDAIVPLAAGLLTAATIGRWLGGQNERGVSGTSVATSATDVGSGDLPPIDVAAVRPTRTASACSPGGRASRSTSWDSSRSAKTCPPTEFLLARYVVTCCVADATIAEVRVVNTRPLGGRAVSVV
jgi:hypothetical protein